MIKTITALVLMLSMHTLSAQMQLEVIPLNHGTTDQVIPVIRPLLPPGGTVSGMNNQLIVKTTPANLAEIKQLLQTIDRPVRSLMITVQQGVDQTGSQQGGGVSGRYNSGDASVSTRRAEADMEGVIISGRDSNGNIIRFNSHDNRSTTTSNNTYSVQTLEGEPAFIQTGISVPVANRNTVITRNGVVVQDTTDYRDASSGFYVLPRINGDRVTLMVAPRLSSVNPGSSVPTFDVQNVQTTVSGRLGEWIQIGGLDQSGSRNNSTLAGSGNRQFSEQRSVLIKVDEIR